MTAEYSGDVGETASRAYDPNPAGVKTWTCMRELVAPIVAAGPWKMRTGEFDSNGSVVWKRARSPESAGGPGTTTAIVR